MNIQAVFFDMGGTIDTHRHDRPSSFRAIEEKVRPLLLQAGLDLSSFDTEQLYSTFMKGLTNYRIWREETLIELPPERIWREFLLNDTEVKSHQLDEVAEELAYTVETRFLKRQMRSEMPEALEAIKQLGVKMGVISNVQSQIQVPRDLTRYNLIHYFDPIVMSSAYGRRKPDPSIFHYAAFLAQVPASACVYVGDRISRDILGACRAGYAMSVQIRHDYKEGSDPVEPVPDAIIDDMRELVDILKPKLQYSHAHPVRSGKKIKAILFDAADILYFRPNKGKWLQAFFDEFGLSKQHVPSDQKKTLKTKAFQQEISIDEYYTELLKLYGVQDEEQIEAGKAALKKESDDIKIFDGVKDTLIGLKERGFLLGIVTDTVLPTYKKLLWFENAGFGHVWDAIVSSRDVGVRKPDPRIYQAALRQLGSTSDQVVFVGHHPAEIRGATNVGLRTIAFNYEEGVNADVYIENFSELLSLPELS